MILKELVSICAISVFMPACGPSKKAHSTLPEVVKDSVQIKADTTIPEIKSEKLYKAKTSPLLETLLQEYPQYFDRILRNRNALNVQIIYTQVNRD